MEDCRKVGVEFGLSAFPKYYMVSCEGMVDGESKCFNEVDVRQDELQLTVKRLAVEALCRMEAEAAAEAD